MNPRRELVAFAGVLAIAVAAFFHESLFGGKVLSPGDVVFSMASFEHATEVDGGVYEPFNRLLIDPVLQFQPWLEFTRSEIRGGRLPLWNPFAGGGAPHLANGQSAVFDPFHLIAYIGTLPFAYAWMAAARLWAAGLGAFLLARLWGYERLGRWFAGLAYPFCGFMVLWLLYPVASVALWLPWMVWASERLIARPSARGIAILGALTACSAFGGHIQTTLHVGLWVFAYAAWRISGLRPLDWRVQRKALASWVAGIVLGVGLSAVSLVPLGCYLTRSPVWADREIDHGSPWVIDPPRFKESICTAIPYAYGSQRRGHPNVARALGIENLNESAGGFGGLATVACLAPLGLIRGSPRGHVRFLGVMTALGFLGAYQIPPVVNVLRATPVLDVVDERRLSLWVAFGLIYLAARGLDAATAGARLAGMWTRFWAIGGALVLTCAFGILVGAPWIRSHAIAAAHDPSEQAKVGRHVERLIHALPVIYSIAGIQLVCLAGVAVLERRSRLARVAVPTSLAVLALADLVGFGFGINPAISSELDRPDSAVIARLRQVAPPPARVLAIGEELPPNLLMRYGLSDIRNYDSIELARSLDAFNFLYEPDPKRQARTSRRTITWDGVNRSLPLLREAGVTVVVSTSPPPELLFERVEVIGTTYLCHTGAKPPRITRETPGKIRIDRGPDSGDVAWVPETFDPGWTAFADGKPCRVQTHQGPFLSVSLPRGSRSILLVYDPVEVRLGMGVSAIACALGLSLASRGVHRGKNARKPCGKRNDRKRIDSTIAATQPASIATAGFDAHGPLFV